MNNQKYTAIGYPAPPPATGYPILEADDDSDKSSSDTNPNPNHNREAKNREISKRVVILNSVVILLFLFFIAFIVFIVAMIVIAVVWRPIDPQIRLTSLSLTGFNVSSFTVSGNWTASFTVFNNDESRQISFSDLNGYVHYNNYVEFAAVDSIPPFALEANSTADLSVAFVPTSPFLDGELLNRIVYDRSRGSMQFDVHIFGNAEFEARGRSISKTSQCYGALCMDIPVEISSNSAAGEFAGGSHNCNIVSGFFMSTSK